jgi:hypothetical protein
MRPTLSEEEKDANFMQDLAYIAENVRMVDKALDLMEPDAERNIEKLKLVLVRFAKKYAGLKLKLEKGVHKIALRVFFTSLTLDAIQDEFGHISLNSVERTADELKITVRYNPEINRTFNPSVRNTLTFRNAKEGVEMICTLDSISSSESPEHYLLKKHAKPDFSVDIAKGIEFSFGFDPSTFDDNSLLQIARDKIGEETQGV